MSNEEGACEHASGPTDKDVVQMLVDSIDEASRRGMTYGQLNSVAEHLHMFALANRFIGNRDVIADYLRTYGEHLAQLVESGVIEFGGSGQSSSLH